MFGLKLLQGLGLLFAAIAVSGIVSLLDYRNDDSYFKTVHWVLTILGAVAIMYIGYNL